MFDPIGRLIAKHESWSLKSVLPAIAPDLRYDDLALQDGGMAMNAYLEALRPRTTTERKSDIRRQLFEHCALDTRALVRIWQYFTGRDAMENCRE